MAYETAFEYFSIALEAARGTAVDPPTHRLPLKGTITPREERFYPEMGTGTLAANTQSVTIKRWSEWSCAGGLDSLYGPVYGNMLFAPVTSPTTPGGATTARLWAFVRAMTADTIKSATGYWGDPNVQIFRTVYNLPETFTIAADASSTDGATIELSGRGKFPTKNAPGSVPAMLTNPPILVPGKMQLWIDTASAIGTTAIADARLVGVSYSCPTGVTYKSNAQGPTSDLSFSGTGRTKTAPELKIRLEVPDTTQFDSYTGSSGDTIHKIRVRINGGLIESTFYHYAELDIYGPLTNPTWGELEGSNRTLEFTIPGHYDATLGSDARVAFQNNRTSL
jgi:hypothetical protein